ncbi:MAG TPA: hypothetical protein VFK79_03540 [Xanthobacteraceae bacterium]|nr:hypothetical protein [Xanthobacteraceae bacterium]
MKMATGLLAGIAILATASAAQAAPKVSGRYAINSTAFCQTLITVSKDAEQDVSGINSPNNGTISSEVGYIQFPNTAASSGDVSIASKGFEASAVRINGAGFGVKPITNALGGSFSLTNTTFTLTVGSQNMVFTLAYGDVVGGVARTLYLVQRESATCLNTVIATKQSG